MATSMRGIWLTFGKSLNTVLVRHQLGQTPCRLSSTLSNVTVERHRRSQLAHDKEEIKDESVIVAPRDYKFVHPEFLPDPNWQHRDRIREMIERKDMLRRRSVIDIPEFYVGSILSVTVSDPHSPKKSNRFVGICIDRGGHGLRAFMMLRNIVEGQGVEIMYELYSPLLLEIEVLKLEKRLDENLYYLRDSPAEYSTVPFDMEKVTHPPGASIPINTLKVTLNPRPWHERWERHNLKGIQPLNLPKIFFERAAHPQNAKPFEKHDLMKQYRESINDDESEDIMNDVYTQMQKIQKKVDKDKGQRQTKGKK